MQYGGILEWLRKEYSGIRSGQASPAILDAVKVEVYGSPMAINQLATITISDPRSLRIMPWDKNVINSIDSAVRQSNLGVSVATDSEGLRISFPQLTAENRQTLLKLAKQRLEEARIKVRNERQKILDDIDKKGAGEDEQKRLKNELQKSVEEANKKLEEFYQKKESELLE
ncbi:MAG: ribosome recycling factor [Candidatus Zambryskibacteria bacterium]|nr:ribosome recycling factor [Candidatus Zambryskibacteria bacterium]